MAKKCLLVGVLVVLLVFTSCSVSNDQSNSVAKVQGKQDYLYLISNYSDGVAWVNYCDATAKDKTREGVHPKCGCINKNGELIFYYDSTDITHDPTDFSNGYAYIESDSGKKLTVIDTSGKICSTYNLVSETNDGFKVTKSGNMDNYCVAYGDGYEVVQTHDSGFDNNSYTYTIYDANNNQVYQLNEKPQKEISVKYWGNGVFSFKNTGFYYSRSGTWVDDKHAKPDGEFKGDMKYSDVVYGERRKTGNYWDYDVHLEYIDTSGNVISTKTVSRSELGWNIKSSDVYNNRCIIYGAPQEDKITKMFIYNFEDNSMVQLTDEKYLNQLSGDFDFHFMTNRIVITTQGQDKKNYYIVFDYDWNVIVEPQKYNYIDVSDNRIIKDFKYVYDENGSLVFEIDDKYVHSTGGAEYAVFNAPTYKDDMLVVHTELDDRFNGTFLGSLGIAAYDLNGKELFNDISMSKASQIEL